jgi:hypothetical protein
VHADNCAIIGNTFSQIFDSAVTPQVYGDGQYATNITIQGNFFDRCGLACVEISNQAGSDARVEHINVIGNHLKSNKGCFAPDIYGGRYAGVTIIFNVKTGTINHIAIKDNDIEDMIHNAMTITECGDDVLVDNNKMRRCETSVFFGPNAGNPTKVVFTRNTSEDSKTHLRVKGDQASAIFQAKDNVFKGGEVAVSDGSSASVQIELIDNTLNAAVAISSERVDGITGSGNVTTGEVDPRFEFLFNP